MADDTLEVLSLRYSSGFVLKVALVAKRRDASTPSPGTNSLWKTVWVAGAVLSDFIISDGSKACAGREIFELGCGSGLASLAAASAGATVLATDAVQASLDCVKTSASLNPGLELRTRTVRWGRGRANRLADASSEGSSDQRGGGGGGDDRARRPCLALAADCLYLSSGVKDVARALDANTTDQVLLMESVNPEAAFAFQDALEGLGYVTSVREIEVKEKLQFTQCGAVGVVAVWGSKGRGAAAHSSSLWRALQAYRFKGIDVVDA